MEDKLIEHRIKTCEDRLNNHGGRIDVLERDTTGLKTELKNLCENLKALTSVMKWFITVLIGAFISFFFYAIQNSIF